VRRTKLWLIESNESGKDWWEKPRNMREKLVLQMVMRDPMVPMKGEKFVWDGRKSKRPEFPWYGKKEWKKYTWTHTSRAGCKTVVHYWKTPEGEKVKPKFKLVKQSVERC
jgi:hypothetical protein